MSYDDRKGGRPHEHPLSQVAHMIADTMRERNHPRHVEPIAWLTARGALYCSACVQPTLAQRAHWRGVSAGNECRFGSCDLCGGKVSA